MAAFNKFHSFNTNLAEKRYDITNDSWQLALCANGNEPSVSADSQLTDLTEITYTNMSSRSLTAAKSVASGVYTLKFNDHTLTASGGDCNPFQYIVIYNSTATGYELFGYYDYGSNYTILDTKTFDIDFGADGGTDGAIVIIS